jgi:hypothetical protein
MNRSKKPASENSEISVAIFLRRASDFLAILASMRASTLRLASCTSLRKCSTVIDGISSASSPRRSSASSLT